MSAGCFKIKALSTRYYNMKRFISTFLLLFCLVAIHAQGGQPVFLETFKPVERVHDFGKVYEKDGKKQAVFELKNTGKDLVVISNVNTSCGCMVPEYTKKAVRPGEKAVVKVTFDPDHKEGNFAKQVILLLNGGKQYVRLWVKANIIPCEHPVQEDHPYAYGHGLYMNQQILPFPDLSAGQHHTFSLKLANNTDKPMSIIFKRVPNNTILKMPARVYLKAKERTTIQVSYRYIRKHTRSGYINVYPIINGKEGKPLKVRWNAGQKFQLLQ